MNENNKPSKMLSDDALERVMLDMFGGLWEQTSEKTPQQSNQMDSLQGALAKESEGDI